MMPYTFVFSFFHLIRVRAKEWLNSQPPSSIHTWDDLVQKFFVKFYPSAKTTQLRMEINSFMQHEEETMVEA